MTPAITPRKMVVALEELQRGFPVFEWRIAGVPMWPLARMRWIVGIWSKAFSDDGGAAPKVNPRRLGELVQGIQSCRRARLADSRADDTVASRRDIVLLSDGVSFADLGGVRFERFCDPLIAHARRLGLTTQMWTPTHLYLTPRATPSRFIQPALDRANAYALAKSLVIRSRTDLTAWNAVQDWLKASGLDTPALDQRRLYRDAVRIRQLSALFASWLAVTKPRAAFVVCYYSLEAMAFVRACRQRGIPVTDLQHGVQGEGHGAYSGWGHVPAHADDLLPDFFWVWSTWEANAISNGLQTDRVCRPVVGGNPWMDFWSVADRPEIQAASASAGSLQETAAGRPVVLVTLQFGLADKFQLDPLRRLIELAGDRYAWWVRLHPAMGERREEVRGKIGATGRTPVWLDLPSDVPMPALLRHVAVHLTHSSSSVIEAAAMEVPSIVSSESGRDLYGPYIDRGLARVELGEADALLAALDECVGRWPREATRASATADRSIAMSRAFEVVTRAPSRPSPSFTSPDRLVA